MSLNFLSLSQSGLLINRVGVPSYTTIKSCTFEDDGNLSFKEGLDDRCLYLGATNGNSFLNSIFFMEMKQQGLRSN